MDLSQILGILNAQGGFSQGGFGAGNANSQEDQRNENLSSHEQKNRSQGNNQILNLLLPLLLSGNLEQSAIFDTLAKTNPLLAQVMSMMPKKKQETGAFRKKNKTTYVKVADYYSMKNEQ